MRNLLGNVKLSISKQLISGILIILCCGAHNQSFAQKLNLNNAEIPLAASTSTPSKKDFSQALLQALQKLSGNPNIDTVPDLQTALSDPKSLVESYSIAQKIGPSGAAENMLLVNFNQRKLFALLQNNQQNIWTADTRPTTLLWIQTQSNSDDKTLLSSDNDSTLKNQLNWQCKTRGLPIIWPMLDLNAQQLLQSSWPLNNKQQQDLLSRYQAGSLLMGTITTDKDGQQSAQWIALVDGTTWQWQTPASKLWQQSAFNHFQNIMSDQYASSTINNQKQTILLTISGINSIDAYAQASGLLLRLPVVTGVSILKSDSSSVTLKVDCISGRQGLISALEQKEKSPTWPLSGSANNNANNTTNNTDDDNQPAPINLQWIQKD